MVFLNVAALLYWKPAATGNLEHFKYFCDIDKFIDSCHANAHDSDAFYLEHVHFALVCYGYTPVLYIAGSNSMFLLHAVSQCGEWKIMLTILLFVVDYVS